MKPITYIDFDTHRQIRRGMLSVLEGNKLPFPVRRVFIVHGVVVGGERGGHAHKKCHQLLVAVCGTVVVNVRGSGSYVLNTPECGLYIPPRRYITIVFEEENTCLLVLASEKYDIDDYIKEDNNGAR